MALARFRKVRFVSLLENGTHVLFSTQMADYATDELTLAKEVLPVLPREACYALRTASSSAINCGLRRAPPEPIPVVARQEDRPPAR